MKKLLIFAFVAMVAMSAVPKSEKKEKFTLLKTLEISIPKDYKFEYHFSDDSINNPLVSGLTYTVKIYSVETEETTKSCSRFIKKENDLLGGFPGLFLIYDLKKEEIKNNTTLSFDAHYKEGVPAAMWHGDNPGPIFGYMEFAEPHKGHLLISFQEKK